MFGLSTRINKKMPSKIVKNNSIIAFQNFIGFENDVYKYLHNTPTTEIAEKIINEGFEFEKYLENSTDMLSGVDIVELRYFKHCRAFYGNYTLIIQIGKELGDYYTNLLSGSKIHFTEILRVKPIKLSNDNEAIYTLPPQFIKGYFDHINFVKIYNSNFNPHFNPPNFEKNVREIIRQ